jgi:ribonucleotide monophosphatase NagD (HAD superfamily)
MDGTLCRGDRLMPGAGEVLATMRHEGRRVLLMSNNALRTPVQHGELLAAMGIDVAPKEILTSVSVLLRHLAGIDGPLFAIGEEPVLETREAAGHQLCDDPAAVACVVAGGRGRSGSVIVLVHLGDRCAGIACCSLPGRGVR